MNSYLFEFINKYPWYIFKMVTFDKHKLAVKIDGDTLIFDYFHDENLVVLRCTGRHWVKFIDPLHLNDKQMTKLALMTNDDILNMAIKKCEQYNKLSNS